MGCSSLQSAENQIKPVHWLGTVTRLLFARESTDEDVVVIADITFYTDTDVKSYASKDIFTLPSGTLYAWHQKLPCSKVYVT